MILAWKRETAWALMTAWMSIVRVDAITGLFGSLSLVLFVIDFAAVHRIDSSGPTGDAP
jgi:hypothetical protein